MKILGFSAFYHDSAAALLDDGTIRFAAEEERFSRQKHDRSFPKAAADFCLRSMKLDVSDLDAIVFYEKPLLKFERLLETYFNGAPRGLKSFTRAMPAWIGEKIYARAHLQKYLRTLESADHRPLPPLFFCEHHHSHAASAFFPSPFDSAAVLCVDGVGERATTSIWHGQGSQLQPLMELHFPHSLGLLYSAFTYHCGFAVNSGEYKLMGLAPYGKPRYRDLILQNIIDIKPDGSFRVNMHYFDYEVGLTMTNENFTKLFDRRRRAPAEEISEFHRDLAASIQSVTEDVLLRLAQTARALTGEKNLCLAGGVALNCVANGRLSRERLFESVWVQPAAGDSGGAIGSALAAYHQKFSCARKTSTESTTSDHMQGARLGPSYSREEIIEILSKFGAKFEELGDDEVIRRTASLIAQGLVVGWFSGPMEFGPRALGSRSILADARRPDMQERINTLVKGRERFRPFAPVVVSESSSKYFKMDKPSPYMLFVTQVKPEMGLPAITHVDGSSRVQTLDRVCNPRLHALLKEFGSLTGVEVLLNTSFNTNEEPIVCAPDEAYRCFLRAGLDALVIENFLIVRTEA